MEQLTLSANYVPNYTFTSRGLGYKWRLYVGKDDKLQKAIIESLHSSAIGGHSEMRATLRIKRLFYWPGLKKSVEQIVQDCAVCQRSKSEHCHCPGLLEPLPMTLPWHISQWTLLKVYPSLMVRWYWLLWIGSQKELISSLCPTLSADCVQTFIENVFRLHDFPLAITSDSDRIFTSKMWKEMF